MYFPNAKPCPFCGGTELDIEKSYSSNLEAKESGWYKQVYCTSCFAAGPRVYVQGNLPSDYEKVQFHWDERK